ncbi:siderophore iron transporter mirB [Echria macrotheca]|uniref:Siderophore iron transporter mirB n=1 Tax=Echria macrotheca TaxID=438768 RepID=A0AAJ0B2E9_9PEZI|nr:siderophore iron transporter mirB [Echria macrotheca]
MTSHGIDVEKDGDAGIRELPSDSEREKTVDRQAPYDADPSEEQQAGVQGIEGAAAVWTKWHLIAAYGLIWLIYFVTSTQEVVVRAFTPFVTSSFSMHSLTAATGIMSSIIAGLSKLPLAKILDVWGRPQGMALMLVFWVIGFIMMAVCDNVETYAAAQVFSLVGAQGVSYCLTVFVADTSALRNRGLMLAFATSPYIVTTWLGGPISEAFIQGAGWRWGFGIWAIITPVVVMPLILLFLWNQRKAKRMGVIHTEKGRLTVKSVKKFVIQFDLLGVLLLAGGMALVLVPLSIWRFQAEQWRSPLIISMLVVGGVLVVVFALYEHFLAPVNFIPMHLVADRTVLCAGIMLTFVFFNSAVWGSYFSSMLMVVWNQTITKATYISNIYRVGSCFSALVMGYAIRRTRRYKWVAVYFSLPLMILGVGLMIHFRQPDSNIGYIIMTQVFVAFAGGPIVVAAEIAMMAPLQHRHLAAILAILDLFGSVGYAIGSAVSAAIWTGTFPEALRKHLPPGARIDFIYSSLYSQLGYPVGSPTRIGISLAYAEAQRYMLITSVIALAAALAAAWMWRDTKLADDDRQVQGVVA